MTTLRGIAALTTLYQTTGLGTRVPPLGGRASMRSIWSFGMAVCVFFTMTPRFSSVNSSICATGMTMNGRPLPSPRFDHFVLARITSPSTSSVGASVWRYAARCIAVVALPTRVSVAFFNAAAIAAS